MRTLYGFNRFHLLIIQIVLFSFIYMLLGSSHFSGINTLEDILKNEIVSKQVLDPIIEEKFTNPPDPSKFVSKDDIQVDKKETEEIKEKAKEIKKEVKKELDVLTEKDNIFDRFFLRFYFSFVTGSTLGYGDTTPSSVICRTIAMIQLVSTFFILMV